MSLGSLVSSARRAGEGLFRPELRSIIGEYGATACGDTPSLESLHWMAAARLVQGRNRAAEDLLVRAMAANSLHVTTPIAVYEWLDEKFGREKAVMFLSLFIGARDASIFKSIDSYVNYLRNSRYIDYPLDIQIETLTRCNTACTFCQYPELTRIGDRMSDELFGKILDDIKTLPTDFPLSITLYGVNEPFLDKRIWNFMRIITDQIPHAQIALNTNGAPLTEKAIDRLKDYRIARMSVSVNDYRKNAYEETMSISFDRTLQVLEILNRKRGSGEISFPLGMTRAGDGSIHDLKFIAWAQNNYPNLSNNFSPRFDWVGDEELAAGLSTAPDTGCTH